VTGSRADRSEALSSVLAADLLAHRAADPAAAGRLARRAAPLLWHVARGQGADAATAEDAVQNALLALIRNQGSIEQPQAVLQWLIVTVRREVGRLARATARVRPTPDPEPERSGPSRDEPENVHLDRERDRVLWDAVGGLSQVCQQLLRTIAFADRPDYAGIAASLGIAVGSIGPTRGRCLAKLRALLAADPRWSWA
jgi:RNA polymerase sigma factor (sigma-70 family)